MRDVLCWKNIFYFGCFYYVFLIGAEGNHLVDFVVTVHCSCSQFGLSGVYMAVKQQLLLSRSNSEKINKSFPFLKEEITITLG